MKKLAAVVVPALLIAATTAAHAQSVSPAWSAYRAKQTSQTPPATPPAQSSDAVAEGVSPVANEAPPATPAYQIGQAQAGALAQRRPAPKGAFFVGVQGGQGKVYEEKSQSAMAVSAGYRWPTGSAGQVGIEVGAGRLKETRWQGYLVPEAKFVNVGANARFNFGRDSAWFGITRLGVLRSETDWGEGDKETSTGVYAGLGVGVDVTRNFNLQLMYTGYYYSNDYSYYDEYTVNRADLFTFGAEVRF